MNSILKGKLFSNRKYWITLLVILIVVAGGVVYYLTSQQQARTSAKTAAATTGLQYSRATRGDLTLTASGTGTLTSSQEVNLSFTSSGTVTKVNVQPGERVKQGDILAVIGDTGSLQTAVQTAELNLLTAKQDLDTFTNGAAAALGNAQLKVATDQKAVDTAKDALKIKGEIRCDATTLQAYYDNYMRLKGQLADLGQPPNGSDYYIKVYLPLQQQVATANAQYVYCNGYTDYEVNSSQANLTVAQATLKTDQDTLDTLKKNNGLDPYQLAVNQNKVTLAENALVVAKRNLDGATISAPLDGTIVSVAGQAGDNAGSTTTTTSGSVTTTSGSTFIVMADLAHPYVDCFIDETDLGKVAVGDDARVIFDALPDRTFTGKVTQLIPKLVTSGNSKAIQGLIRIDSILADENLTLPEGLNASVDIIGGKAQNAVLIPISALVDLGNSEYGVFVRDTTGKLKFRSVTVGLMDLTNAEIKSGLEAGETVTTGTK